MLETFLRGLYEITAIFRCRLILNSSQGIRASNVGQLGGGVSICLASPVELGWGTKDFPQRVGKELWGSKWFEVMPKPKPDGAAADWGKFANKLEAVFVVQVPSELNRDQSRIVPVRSTGTEDRKQKGNCSAPQAGR
eukprot:COSAG02_NODE_28_length_51367_cov_70.053932_37_plen_137_part_00